MRHGVYLNLYSKTLCRSFGTVFHVISYTLLNVTPCGNTARVSGMWLGQQRFPSRQENDGYCMTPIENDGYCCFWLVNLLPLT